MPRVLYALLRLFKPFVGNAPTVNVSVEELGKNLVYQDAVKKDPLYYKNKMRLSTFIEILKAGAKIRGSARKVNVPYIMYHGSQDQFVFAEVTLKNRRVRGKPIHLTARQRLKINIL